jgi:hypothetical protein
MCRRHESRNQGLKAKPLAGGCATNDSRRNAATIHEVLVPEPAAHSR